jgi:molybdenum cofactor synthesis domain-containing protein
MVIEYATKLGWSVTAAATVPDDSQTLATKLSEMADSSTLDVILTTGGTGVSVRDITPEATRTVIDREIPGLAELMRSEGRKSTKFAPLSRAVAGTRGKVLIVNLPGSPKGAIESLSAVAELIPHVIDLLQGRTEHQGGEAKLRA